MHHKSRKKTPNRKCSDMKHNNDYNNMAKQKKERWARWGKENFPFSYSHVEFNPISGMAREDNFFLLPADWSLSGFIL